DYLGVYFSTDAGTTWTAINAGLETHRVQALAIDPMVPGRVYVGTAGASVFTGDFPGICGNGTVELGEQCDGDLCCAAACQFESAATPCRPVAGACDLAESCTGGSGACPADAKS